MAINFPTSLDNFTNPSSGNTLDSPSHSLQHSDINDAVEAMQRKVGVGSSVAGSASAGQVLTISAAGTSTWSTPTPGGLVQVVPTSVAVGSGSGSVDANGAVTFTGASSVSLNGCFSSSYDNYKIVMSGVSSGDVGLNIRLRISGADNTTSNYTGTGMFTNNAVGPSRTSDLNQPAFYFGSFGDQGFSNETTIFNPFSATLRTIILFNSFAEYGSDRETTIKNGLFNATTQFDSISFYPGSGTFTGIARVYGLKN